MKLLQLRPHTARLPASAVLERNNHRHHSVWSSSFSPIACSKEMQPSLFSSPSVNVSLISATLLTHSQPTHYSIFRGESSTNEIKHFSQFAPHHLPPSFAAKLYAHSPLSLRILHSASHCSSHSHIQSTCYPPAHEENSTNKRKYVIHFAPLQLTLSPKTSLYA